MEQEPEKPNPPAIPPPNLSKPPPPPSSPMDALISSRPPVMSSPPSMTGEPPVKVKIFGESELDENSAEKIPSFNTRALAMLIDLVVVVGISITLNILLTGFATQLAWLAGVAYIILRDSIPFLGGQSIGKKAMKIKVVTLDDKPLTGNWEAAVVRNLILVIPLLGLIELFILLTREDKPDRGRRLGDEWAKTKVIVVPTPTVEENPG